MRNPLKKAQRLAKSPSTKGRSKPGNPLSGGRTAGPKGKGNPLTGPGGGSRNPLKRLASGKDPLKGPGDRTSPGGRRNRKNPLQWLGDLGRKRKTL
ncbi:hypothetical protein [Nocardiopsis lambiniae]|uniref:Uncharacterized protein n=1 Tax=Nocardiopsis lambiniae TaxID=3075539 RepID=A0ABU2MGV4_9ACTN|nr:hypothetical protein [Nocardiopsis sp. DSM 44743]MDT0331935.1 hypothetical protein [Nocardiopsis sp. DSM 44743]